MSRGGGYDITPRSTVIEELSKLDITLPTNNIGLLRLGQSLGVSYIVTGDITDVTISYPCDFTRQMLEYSGS